VVLKSYFECRLSPLAQRTLVCLAHPLDVCEATEIACRYQTVMQYLEIVKRQEGWHMVVLHVQGSGKPHEWTGTLEEGYAHRAYYIRSLCNQRWFTYGGWWIACDKSA
jgi:hypothetical protein